MNTEMQVLEAQAHRAQLMRRAAHIRQVDALRRAQRQGRRYARINVIAKARVTVLVAVGRRMVAWGTALQRRYGDAVTASAALNELRPAAGDPR
jgi:hypothetical protein